MDVFRFNNYRDYIRAKIDEHAEVRGYRSRLADAGGFQRSFLPQVLGEKVNLTLEQGIRLAKFWGLSETETEYFVELVNLARAGTQPLIRMIEKRLGRIRRDSRQVRREFRNSNAIEREKQATYYSTWHYAAIHVLASIENYRKPEDFASRLGLPLARVLEVLRDLRAMKVLSYSKNKGWSSGVSDLFLTSPSPMMSVNHRNWRAYASSRLMAGDSDGIFYTNVHALSLSDIESFRKIILDTIHQTKQIVDKSPEEEAVCFTCDFFSL